MSEPYEELLQGEAVHRGPPTADHELLVTRLHRLVAGSLPLNSALCLLPPRSELLLGEHSVLRPDLAVIRLEQPAATVIDVAQLYLVAEVLLPGDHHADTVIKKQLWADSRLPRLWMVDPRYLNVEVYGLGEFGFTLTDILANHHPLTDPHLPGLSCPMHELFANI
ncbi:MAG: Uma2 family endonuclease [bacterium]|nr:Uma2 family endonuclease [bacterium]MDI1337712.1 Uma2 family endonuclease [Lacunisphaera sp.]